MARWMIYGANGYTGRLCAALAKERGLAPILAGRDGGALEPLARALGLEMRVAGLDEPSRTRAALDGIAAVLHCAGPFSATSRPMVDACLAAGASYLDVTGEIAVFEAVHARDPEAKRAGVTLLPGVGFDVVPTDCLAAMLHTRLPEATELELAFFTRGAASRGTTSTMIEALPEGGRARIAGRIERVPAGWRRKRVRFHDEERDVVSIPWGDVSTAFYSTRIPNITTYMAMPPAVERLSALASRAPAIAGHALVQRGLKALVAAAVTGPSERDRARAGAEVWGRVTAPDGRSVTGTLSTPNGYALTADAALRALERVLAGTPPGALTPSLAFGADFVRELDGVTVHPFAPDRSNGAP
jgi:saccharopine dehydrogenase (NAD+, L-lysine-forming)